MRCECGQESISILLGGKQKTEYGYENGYIIRFHKDYKVTIMSVFQELEKKMTKEVKEIMIIPHQMETINKEIRIIKTNQILELKTIITMY
jgi:uncharacterized protein YbgA (DUF1722 family)